MKDYLELPIAEMEVEDVTFEVDFEAWTDKSGPGPDEGHIDILKRILMAVVVGKTPTPKP